MLKIVSHEESVNFADFRRSNCIHTQSVTQKKKHSKKYQLHKSSIFQQRKKVTTKKKKSTCHKKKARVLPIFGDIISYIPATSFRKNQLYGIHL